MSWYLAPSLKALRGEVDKRWPTRSRVSDGSIGDAAHRARKSDHNPDSKGCVHAVDITASGIDTGVLIDRCIKDPRVAYVIHDRRIWAGGKWSPYKGANPHVSHVHVSIRHSGNAESSTSSWGIAAGAVSVPAVKPAPAPAPAAVKRVSAGPLAVDGKAGRATIIRAQSLVKGLIQDGVLSGQAWGNRKWTPGLLTKRYGRGGSALVRALQSELNRKYNAGLKVDGDWGKATSAAMQRALGLRVDYVFGVLSAKAWQARLNTGVLI